jgi:hypothetical protein
MGKIISKAAAKKLIRTGDAEIGPTLVPDESGRVYVAVTRLDAQRVDHYLDHIER